MTQVVEEAQTRAFVVLNPVAGRTTPEAIRSALDLTLGQAGWQYTIHETQPDEDISQVIETAVAAGCAMVIAAGGDGTVSLVANSLVGKAVPLGILPAGSANVMALELGIPSTIPEAAALLVAEHHQRELDVMQLADHYFILQIGVGLDSLMIKDTDREAKRRLGRWAYMQTLARHMLGFESQRYTIAVDGRRMRLRAAQVLIANAGTLGAKPLSWGEHIHPNDGHLDLCIVKVRTLMDYPRVLYQFATGRRNTNANIQYMRIEKSVTLASDHPLPVQADGEIIGTTPIRVLVVPKGIKVIVPLDAEPAAPIKVAREADRKDNDHRAQEDAMSDDAQQAADQTQYALEHALKSIDTPEKADRVIADLEHMTQGVSERTVIERTPTPSDANTAAANVTQAAHAPKATRPQAVIGELATQIAAADSSDEPALSQGAQQATNPSLQATKRPHTTAERKLLQEALLRRLTPLQKLDATAFLAINNLPHPQLVNELFIGLTTAFNRGDAWAAGLIIAALRDSRQRAVLLDVLPPLWLTAGLVEGPIKGVFRRQRPFSSVVRAIVVGKRPGNYSFPSGHSAAAFGGAYLLTRHYPQLAPLFYTIASLVAFSRVYLGAHYPGDVLSGAIVGTALAGVSQWTFQELLESIE